MRSVRTFILPLLVDSDEPEALRGDLRPMPRLEPQPFADEQAILGLLRRLTGGRAEPFDTGADARSLGHRFSTGGEPW